MASVQEEERTRVNQFVFRDDAVLSLVNAVWRIVQLRVHLECA